MNLVEYYQILDLQPEASVEEIDFAFGKQRMELVRQNRKSEIPILTTAYHHLRDLALDRAVAASTEIDSHLPEYHIGKDLDQLLQSSKIRTTVSIIDRQLQVQLHSRTGSVRSNVAIEIVKRLQILDPVGIETIVICGMRGQKSIAWKQKFQIDQAIKSADTDPFSFDNRYINRGALPIAILVAIVAQLLVFPRLLLRPAQIWIHEFGHATVAWLAGHQATPLPFGWTNVGEDRSLIVYLCFLALLLIFLWTGWREQKRWVMGIAGVLAIVQFYMTWVMSIDTFLMWLSFGGVGGEFYLSTLIMICFYFPLPDKFRWDFWRYIALLFAACTFVESFRMWHNIKTGSADIPWGTMLGGQGDTGGDMNNLIAFGWSDLQIVNTYSHLGNICLFLLIGIYAVFVLRSLQDRSWRQLSK
jgi:hypothetical protein